MHEAVTRNHRCKTVQELLDLTFDWFETRTHFRVQTGIYDKAPGKWPHFAIWRAVFRGVGGVKVDCARRSGSVGTAQPSGRRRRFQTAKSCNNLLLAGRRGRLAP